MLPADDSIDRKLADLTACFAQIFKHVDPVRNYYLNEYTFTDETSFSNAFV